MVQTHPKQVSLFGSLVAVILLGGLLTGASANSVYDYTGCLTPGGDITNVAEGSDPLKECKGNSIEIHWNETGPQGPQGEQGPPGPQGEPGPAGEAPFFGQSCPEYAFVVGFSSSGEMLCGSGPGPDAYEPNGSAEDAYPLGSYSLPGFEDPPNGDTLGADLGPTDTVDWYRVGAVDDSEPEPESEFPLLDVFGAGVRFAEADMYLYDDSGTLLDSSLNEPDPFVSHSWPATTGVDDSRTFLVEVRYRSGPVASYNLDLSFSQYPSVG